MRIDSKIAERFTADSFSEEVLPEHFKRGDLKAFEYACTLYYPRLLRTAVRLVHDPEDARDAVQDAFLSALKGMRSFRGASSVSTWLTRIVINACLIQLRKERRHVVVSLDEPVNDSQPLEEIIEDKRIDPVGAYLSREREEILAAAMQRLRPDFRIAIELQQFAEESLSEIARKVRTSVPAMKSRLYRAKSMLRKDCNRLSPGGLKWARSQGSRRRSQLSGTRPDGPGTP